MLRSVAIVCPFCKTETTIRVSTGGGKDMQGATSSCRACRRSIMTVTFPDGMVAHVDEERIFPLPLLDAGRTEALRRGPHKRHQVLPPQHLGLFDRGGVMEAPTGISDAEIEAGQTIVECLRRLSLSHQSVRAAYHGHRWPRHPELGRAD